MKFNAEVYQAESHDDLWQSLLKPWLLRAQLKSAGGLPMAMLLPHGPWEAYLKRSMGQASISAFNVHFLTPGKMRVFLNEAAGGGNAVHSSEAFDTITAAQAYQSEIPYAKAIYNTPASFVRACNKVVLSGHSLKDFFSNDLDAFVEEWKQSTKALNGVQENDRSILALLLKQKKPIFDELFITGFTGRDWGLFPFLLASLCVAKKTHLCLPLVREGLHEELWIGTWENMLGAAAHVKGETRFSREPEAEFLLSKTVVDEAERIAKRALLAASLEEETCVVVPGPCALAQEIKQQFERHSIPYYDGLGGFVSVIPKERLVSAWLTFMREPTLAHFSVLIREEQSLNPELAATLTELLRRAHCEVLIDDFELLKVHALSQYSVTKSLRDFLSLFSVPKPEGFFKDYFAEAEAFLEACFKDLFTELKDEAVLLSGLLNKHIPFRLFLKWVEATFLKKLRARSRNGSYIFSNIYLLSSEQADGLIFDTIILAGLDGSQWSGKPLSSLFEPEPLIRSKNRQTIIQGSQGEGHRAVRLPYSYILTEEDIFKEARARQERLTCSARKVRIFSASMASDRDFKINQPLDDCYQSAYREVYGHYLGEEELPNLLEDSIKRIPREKYLSNGNCISTRNAYQARRDECHTFGPYEYTFSPRSRVGYRLSCSQWERCIKQPSDVWYKTLACVEPEENPSIASIRSKAQGIWIHHWLVFFRDNAQLKRLPELELWEACLNEKANLHRKNVTQSYMALGKNVPDWWHAEWFRARFQAQTLMRSVLDIQDFPFFAQELNLPESAHIVLGDDCHIPLSGRMDLILSNEESSLDANESRTADLWVIDFKTGQRSAVTLAKLEKGEGLQLALYAAALQRESAPPVGFSIFGTQGKSTKHPQLTLDQVQSLQPIWHFMKTVNNEGILGQRTQVRNRFNEGARFPLATLNIPQNILEKKWHLAHPNITLED